MSKSVMSSHSIKIKIFFCFIYIKEKYVKKIMVAIDKYFYTSKKELQKIILNSFSNNFCLFFRKN